MKAKGLRIVVGLISLFLIPMLGQAQNASFGLSAGVPLNPLATSVNGLVSASGRYTFGPAFRVSLPHRLGIDAEVLYKRFDFGFASGPRIAVHRLELPLLLRFAFSSAPIRPFAHVGISFDRIIAVTGSTACADGGNAGKDLYCIEGQTVAQLRHRLTHGPVFGAGLEFALRAIRLAPELRITRWVDRNFGTRDASLRSNLTQVEMLLGLRF